MVYINFELGMIHIPGSKTEDSDVWYRWHRWRCKH